MGYIGIIVLSIETKVHHHISIIPKTY